MIKMINTLGWGFLFSLILCFSTIYQFQKIDAKIQKIQIQKYEEESLEVEIYFGYISFPKTGEQRLIKYGNADKIVNEFYIGIFGTIPEKYPQDSLILVGHNRYMQFSSLENLKTQDQVIITRKNQHYFYKVNEKIIQKATDLTFLKFIKKKQLILITCLEDSNQRLIVFCDFMKSDVSN